MSYLIRSADFAMRNVEIRFKVDGCEVTKCTDRYI